MASALEDIRKHLAELRARLDEDLDHAQARLNYRLDHGRAVFDAEVLARQRALRVRLGTFLRQTRPLVVLTAPVIYALILPVALLDLAVSLYQAICFPVYGIAKVRRRDHLVLDRHLLAYLNLLQKLNCLYCGYCNGVISYVREVAARTEQYWCPIKHARRAEGLHECHADFADYGDAEDWLARLPDLRAALRPQADETRHRPAP
ncbi:hypothetical protein SAMN04488103_103167 [Gemmobacter aquatilis]|uniref:Uncharacterized protein n=1 Tax=Gemmobacter aquatilis TaxID=933059 RepID=A0A1H8DY89_9RHOB|nr:hypothetical protein [Gemmobacter aquatilis]SEN12279.1 hypothetical protein SAMN04488103_103167 [Gemmobacter aquatilis]